MFQRWNGYTGSSLYESWSLSMFNTLFTSLPVIFLGIFEKDLQASTLLAVPELYNFGQKNRGFNYRIYFGWMLLATSQAMLTYFVMFQIYAKRLMVDQSVYALGVLTYTTVIILISTKIQIIEMHNKSYMAALSFVLSVGGWYASPLPLPLPNPANPPQVHVEPHPLGHLHQKHYLQRQRQLHPPLWPRPRLVAQSAHCPLHLPPP